MTAKRPRRLVDPAQARGVLLWAAVVFVLGQVALFALMERPNSPWRDPESGLKLHQLGRRLRERPGAYPLIVALGTSRTGMGFRPDVLLDSLEPGPMAFNYAANNGGPLLDLMYLRRLRESGIRPRIVLLELWPVSLRVAGAVAIEGDRDRYLRRARSSEAVELARHVVSPMGFLAEWAGGQVIPCLTHRSILLGVGARDWLPRDSKVAQRWEGIDGWGFQSFPWTQKHDPGKYRTELPRWEKQFASRYGSYRISPVAETSLRQALELCGKEHIHPVLIRMPESPSVRRWTTPRVQEEVDHLVRLLKQDHHFDLIDARDWIAEEGFIDPVHLSVEGATAFSRRLARDGLAVALNAVRPPN